MGEQSTTCSSLCSCLSPVLKGPFLAIRSCGMFAHDPLLHSWWLECPYVGLRFPRECHHDFCRGNSLFGLGKVKSFHWLPRQVSVFSVSCPKQATAISTDFSGLLKPFLVCKMDKMKFSFLCLPSCSDGGLFNVISFLQPFFHIRNNLYSCYKSCTVLYSQQFILTVPEFKWKHHHSTAKIQYISVPWLLQVALDPSWGAYVHRTLQMPKVKKIL